MSAEVALHFNGRKSLNAGWFIWNVSQKANAVFGVWSVRLSQRWWIKAKWKISFCIHFLNSWTGLLNPDNNSSWCFHCFRSCLYAAYCCLWLWRSGIKWVLWKSDVTSCRLLLLSELFCSSLITAAARITDKRPLSHRKCRRTRILLVCHTEQHILVLELSYSKRKIESVGWD